MTRKQRLLVRLLLMAPVSAALVFNLLAVAGTRAVGQEKEVLSLEAHIPLPSVKGRIDHFSVDVKGQRLFVAAVENHTLEIADLKSGQRVHTITDLAEPQGVFYDPATPKSRARMCPRRRALLRKCWEMAPFTRPMKASNWRRRK
jgi:hypothetical protein